MEEWEYLEGHKELYKDVMMARQPALTSPDGSSNGNPPERCPHPLYSLRDPTQENLTIPHHHQSENLGDSNIVFKEEYKEEDEEYGVMEEPFKAHQDLYKDIKMEPPRTPPERCPSPSYFHRDPTQDEELKVVKIEGKEEGDETLVSENRPSMQEWEMTERKNQEEYSLHKDTNGLLDLNTSEGEPIGCVEDDDITQSSPRRNLMTRITHHRDDHVEASMDPSNPEPESSDPSHTMTSSIRVRSQRAERATPLSNPPEPCDQNLIGEHSLSFTDCKTSLTDNKALPQQSHTGERPNSCSECGKCFIEKATLIQHQRMHTKKRPYSCSECGKCFTEKAKLIRHQRIHTGERPYSCSECGKCFTEKGNLNQHLKVHTGELPYSCSECGKCFSEKRKLIKHQSFHTGAFPYSCSECGKSFTERASLIRHQRIHTGVRPYSCPECGKCFSHKGTLITHQRSHTAERPYSCSVCGKCFKYKESLLTHQRSHTGDRPYSCSECGKCFRQKITFTIHQRIHTDVRPYSCSECGKCFRHKGALTTHQRSHTAEHPYSCSVCGKCFMHKESLLTHQRNHRGERPYSCLDCGKCFNCKGNLTRHQRVHTGKHP